MNTPKREIDPLSKEILKDRHIGGLTADAEEKKQKLLPPIEGKAHPVSQSTVGKSGGLPNKTANKSVPKPLSKGGKKS